MGTVLGFKSKSFDVLNTFKQRIDLAGKLD